jgi:very-short-patch-repair endonuclease
VTATFSISYVCGKGVIIEVDGGQHGIEMQSKADRERDAHFSACGFKILRFWNNDIDENIDGVLATIAKQLHP